MPVVGGLLEQTTIEVQYIDVPGEWREDGVESLVSDDRNSVSCSASHLTDFAGIVLYPPPPPQYKWPTYSGEDITFKYTDQSLPFPSRVGEIGLYLLVFDVLTTLCMGFMIHQSSQRGKLAVLSTTLLKWRDTLLAAVAWAAHKLYRRLLILRYQYCSRGPLKRLRGSMPEELMVAAKLDFTVIEAKNVVAKDGAGYFNNKPNTSSDPYVVIRLGKRKIASCPVIYKTLNPKWELSFHVDVEARHFSPKGSLTFAIMDKDKDSFDDPMGEVNVPLSSLFFSGVSEGWHDIKNCKGCNDASGTLHLKLMCDVQLVGVHRIKDQLYGGKLPDKLSYLLKPRKLMHSKDMVPLTTKEPSSKRARWMRLLKPKPRLDEWGEPVRSVSPFARCSSAIANFAHEVRTEAKMWAPVLRQRWWYALRRYHHLLVLFAPKSPEANPQDAALNTIGTVRSREVTTPQALQLLWSILALELLLSNMMLLFVPILRSTHKTVSMLLMLGIWPALLTFPLRHLGSELFSWAHRWNENGPPNWWLQLANTLLAYVPYIVQAPRRLLRHLNALRLQIVRAPRQLLRHLDALRLYVSAGKYCFGHVHCYVCGCIMFGITCIAPPPESSDAASEDEDEDSNDSEEQEAQLADSRRRVRPTPDLQPSPPPSPPGRPTDGRVRALQGVAPPLASSPIGERLNTPKRVLPNVSGTKGMLPSAEAAADGFQTPPRANAQLRPLGASQAQPSRLKISSTSKRSGGRPSFAAAEPQVAATPPSAAVPRERTPLAFRLDILDRAVPWKALELPEVIDETDAAKTKVEDEGHETADSDQTEAHSSEQGPSAEAMHATLKAYCSSRYHATAWILNVLLVALCAFNAGLIANQMPNRDEIGAQQAQFIWIGAYIWTIGPIEIGLSFLSALRSTMVYFDVPTRLRYALLTLGSNAHEGWTLMKLKLKVKLCSCLELQDDDSDDEEEGDMNASRSAARASKRALD